MGDVVEGSNSMSTTVFAVVRFMLGFNDIAPGYNDNPNLYCTYSIILLLLFFYLLQPVTLTLLIDAFDQMTKDNCHHSDLTANVKKMDR